MTYTTRQELREARESAGLSQAMLAKAIGVSERQLIRIENGTSNLSGPVAIAVWHVLNCPKENAPG